MSPGLVCQKETAEESIQQEKISSGQSVSDWKKETRHMTEWPWRRVSAAMPRAAGGFLAACQQGKRDSRRTGSPFIKALQ
ncbi:hypothetical protein, partial [Klebsiella oxytoca]|uniref:hypothetical protein n=1 Tax=Klebsiella oxytoca TaxID=571 RepID=UPI001C9E983B